MKKFWERFAQIAHDKWESTVNYRFQFIPNLFSAVHGYAHDKYNRAYFKEIDNMVK